MSWAAARAWRSASKLERSIDRGDRWLIYCFALCQPLDICNALGIGLGDLFLDDQAEREYVDGNDRRGNSVPRTRAGEFLKVASREAWVVALIALQAAIERAETKRRELLAAQPAAKHSAKLFAMILRVAEEHRESAWASTAIRARRRRRATRCAR